MSDIFREIEEDLQRDRYKKLWEKYGNLVIAAAVALVLSTAGWQVWKTYRVKRDQAFGARNPQAHKHAQDRKTPEAEQGFAQLPADPGSGYTAVSRRHEA